MEKSEFISYWKDHYPESFPIGHELKWVYQDRWLRIHSLPKSKRYAETKDEYKIILNRQNQLIEDLIGEGTEMIISFGLYGNDITNENYKTLRDFLEFEKVMTIDLHKERPKAYEEEMHFDIYVMIDKWKRETKNEILKAIADDEIRAMFVCPSKGYIIAPYDGGVDIIANSTEKRDELKTEYKDWLSKREDGL
ncbi:hypothetical protein [Aureispira sp. CCB-QB1]|uniref:DUF3885 domain-containing protein n=1 Tax=Aureispira sp. CCB-QB1 TaxID=1313421 RepID=UPI000698D43B|nr:hypothetical protein [Aureispira sp. CCB-QB1]